MAKTFIAVYPKGPGGTYSVPEYRRVMDKRAKEIRKMQTKTVSQAAKKFVELARALAPRYSGETIAGIKSYPKGKGKQQVESRVSGNPATGFLQNLWANQSTPFKRPKLRWNNGQPTLYGSVPARWTGRPGFFNLAALRTRDTFRKLSVKNTRKALKVTIG